MGSRPEFFRDLRQFSLRVLVGQKAALVQRIDAAGENLDVVGHKRRNFGESARKFPPFGEVGHELSEFVVDL